MKGLSYILALALSACYTLSAQNVTTSNLRTYLNEGNVCVDFDLDAQDKAVRTNGAIAVTPVIVKGDKEAALSSVVVYGHNSYYYYLRNNGSDMLSGEGETTIRSKDLPKTISYHDAIPYEPWMENSDLELRVKEYGCCGESTDQADAGDSPKNVYMVEKAPLALDFAYVTPTPEEVKARAISGSANVIFRLNKTDIDRSYDDNASGLRKITSSLDSVKDDSYATIKSITLKGYASPEGKYSINEKLAKGRTEAVKNFISSNYDIDSDKISVSYEPENWEDLRQYVEDSDLSDKDGILDIIDGSLEPDPKEWKLKSTYPEAYKTLREDCYPYLRKTEFKIDYEIKNITDVEEIKRLVKTHPQSLSLNEFYQAAQAYEPGSDDYNEVFDVAVRQYPDDPVANLNAANAEMSRGDMKLAAKHLAKAGDSAEAEYARGVYAALSKDYDAARKHFTAAENGGMAEASDAIKKIDEYLGN